LKNHVAVNKVNGSDGELLVDIKEDIRTAILTWNFPKTLNALSMETLTPLIEQLAKLEEDDRIGVVVLTGVQNTFSAGANIAGFQEDFKFTGAVKFKSPLMKDWARPINEFSKPIIAAINGYCFGGGLEVAMMCDILIASDVAMFGLPEIKLGLIPGAGGTQALVRNVGKSKAMEMILTGTPISAEEALNI
jgi:enoyl-CoA hydratase/carnithine racemase